MIRGTGSSESDRLLVPANLREEVLALVHDSSAHQGVQRTKLMARENFYWWRMGDSVRSYVLTCDTCCRNKRGHLPLKAGLKSYQAGSPMEKVYLDFLGPLPRTEAGNEYIPMMVNSFTKWVECVPLPSQTAEMTARAAINEFSLGLGIPLRSSLIRAGSSRANCSKKFVSFCRSTSRVPPV